MRYICTSIVATLVLVGTSFAATINVPSDQPTIAAAISASVNGDVINIAAGTYNEHSLNTGGKAITIGSASGNRDVTIDAQQGGSVFMFESGEGSGTEIKDLVITGGSASTGGGILCKSNSNPTISGCTISGNTANYGGGIFCWLSSNPTITDCTISDNTVISSGSGIFCEDSNPTITGCTIEGNTANFYGGGILCGNSNATISGCTISGNTGGGIYCDWGSNPTISGCTIESNTASTGGGILCNFNSNPTISGCTISGNTVSYRGGGIYCYDNSSPTISGCTIEGNTAEIGGGINCLINSNPTITGCTFTSNMPDTIVGDFNMGEPASTTGACCVSSGCHALTEDACAGMGGTWLGEGGSCDDCPASCMGDTDGNGVVDIEDLLNMLGSWGACP